ncbi:MAG: hypothetical protein ABI134_17130, partial [Byssovorax sp.]
YAQGWLDYFVNRRKRALELMAEGYLEAEHGVEMIPPVLLTQPSSSRAKEKAITRGWYAGAAVAAVAALAVIIPLRAARADDHAYRLAVRAQPAPSYGVYLEEYPTGRHAEEAQRAVARPYVAAAASFGALFVAGEKRGAAAGIPAALDALRAEGVSTVPVTITSKDELSFFSGSDRDQAAWVYGATSTTARERDLLERLGRIFEVAGLGETMRLFPANGATKDAPVTLTIHKITTEEGKLFEAPGRPAIPAIQIAWEAVLSLKGNDTPLWRYQTTSTAPAELRLDRQEAGDTPRILGVALRQMELLGLDDFTGKVARELGLSGEPPRLRTAEQGSITGKTRSPYER